MNDALPFEISEFEQLLNKPNGDASGLASFFAAGEVWVARVPARLDVMGGIADYSGANVCEAVLGRGMLMALAGAHRPHAAHPHDAGRPAQPCRSRRACRSIIFNPAMAVGGYAEIRELCQANPLANWAAYIGGSIFTLLKEEPVKLRYGFSLPLVQRRADERRHRQFRRRRDRHVELPQCVSRSET